MGCPDFSYWTGSCGALTYARVAWSTCGGTHTGQNSINSSVLTSALLTNIIVFYIFLYSCVNSFFKFCCFASADAFILKDSVMTTHHSLPPTQIACFSVFKHTRGIHLRVMPDKLSLSEINGRRWGRNHLTCNGGCLPPQSPLISDYGHLRGHYPANIMVTCQRKKKIKAINIYFHGFYDQNLKCFTRHNLVSLITPEGLNNHYHPIIFFSDWKIHYFSV